MADVNPYPWEVVLGCTVAIAALLYGAHKHADDLDAGYQEYLDSRKRAVSTHQSPLLIPQEPLASAVPESANFTFSSATPNSTTSPAIPVLAHDNGLPLGDGTSYIIGSDILIPGQGVLIFAGLAFVLFFSLLVWKIERMLCSTREQDAADTSAELTTEHAEGRGMDADSCINDAVPIEQKYHLALRKIAHLEQQFSGLESPIDDLLAEISAAVEPSLHASGAINASSAIQQVDEESQRADDKQSLEETETSTPLGSPFGSTTVLVEQEKKELLADDLLAEISVASAAAEAKDNSPCNTTTGIENSLDVITRADIKADKRLEPAKQHMIHVHQIPVDVPDAALIELFTTKAGNISRRPIMQPRDGLSEFGAIFYFEDPASCLEALEMDGTPHKVEKLVRTCDEEKEPEAAADSRLVTDGSVNGGSDFQEVDEKSKIDEDEQRLPKIETTAPLNSPSVNTPVPAEQLDQSTANGPRLSAARLNDTSPRETDITEPRSANESAITQPSVESKAAELELSAETRVETESDLSAAANIDEAGSKGIPSTTQTDCTAPSVDEVDDAESQISTESATVEQSIKREGVSVSQADAEGSEDESEVEGPQNQESQDEAEDKESQGQEPEDEAQDEAEESQSQEPEEEEAGEEVEEVIGETGLPVMAGEKFIKDLMKKGVVAQSQHYTTPPTAEEKDVWSSKASVFNRPNKAAHMVADPVTEALAEDDGADNADEHKKSEEESEEAENEDADGEKSENEDDEDDESDQEVDEDAGNEKRSDDQTGPGDRDGAGMSDDRSPSGDDREADESELKSNGGDDDDGGDGDEFPGADGGHKEAAAVDPSSAEFQPAEEAVSTPVSVPDTGAGLRASTNANGSSSAMEEAQINVQSQESSQDTSSQARSKPLNTGTAVEPATAAVWTKSQSSESLENRPSGATTSSPMKGSKLSEATPVFTPRAGTTSPKPLSTSTSTRIPTSSAGGRTNPVKQGAVSQGPHQSSAPQPPQRQTATQVFGLDNSRWAPANTGARPGSRRHKDGARGPIIYNKARFPNDQQTPATGNDQPTQATGSNKQRRKDSQWRRKDWVDEKGEKRFDEKGEKISYWRNLNTGVVCWVKEPHCKEHDPHGEGMKQDRAPCSEPEGFKGF